ncbi:N-formylglutamate amidohydrolase [Labrenzia sp. PHM005]|uniref:N-formylglutamate amidohydrolase n=1 Tax=Labrenzia sp. PHM005 TaxID=2590016 RepID=UPI0011408E3E|nr:N-formylglutamate amidohydrolase [Labrenzia sp. PHM005]QDG74852.1 formiminoglutamase [Labrenzia sp. PHM005]
MILIDEGQSPLVLCLPHSGTEIPAVVERRLNATGRLQTDVSWRLEDVMRFSPDLDATVVRSTVSRYVIDLDRDPETPLNVSEDPASALCPVTTLDGKRLYLEGEEPGETEVEQRVLLFSTPFLKALRQQVDRLLKLHHKVIVLDCQSMRSTIKGVTDKGLPVISVGSMDGTSCDPDLRNLLVGSFKSQKGYTVGVDEMVKGGFLTQSFGRPDLGLHALTLLFAQRAYLRHESPPFEPDKTRIQRLSAFLEDCFSRAVDWAEMKGEALRSADGSAVGEDLETETSPADEMTVAEPESDGFDEVLDGASEEAESDDGQGSKSALQVAE